MYHTKHDLYNRFFQYRGLLHQERQKNYDTLEYQVLQLM